MKHIEAMQTSAQIIDFPGACNHTAKEPCNMATQEFTPSVERLKFAIKYLEDEHETLLALAIVLMNRLEPNDPYNPEDGEDGWLLRSLTGTSV